MDGYHIIELIGEGSFGKVYKGRRKQTGQVVAVKFIPKKGKNEKELRNLRQEISILRKLNHENIILMLDSFETKSDFCVVMEHAQGELFEILEEDKALPEAVVQSVAKQLIRALNYLHMNRVIHRDMKPQNILVAPDGVVKLCDFGFARVMSNNTQVLTSFKGTPLYMAPEVVQGRPYNHKADLWSLGVILYELYLGVPPFYTNNMRSLMQFIVEDPVKYPKNASTEFKSFLKGLLAKNAKDRSDWPQLLEHPFVAETPEEKAIRLHKASLDVGRRRLERFDPNSRSSGIVSRQRRNNQKKRPAVLKSYQYDQADAHQPNSGILQKPANADLIQLEKICHSEHGAETILKDPNALNTIAMCLQSFGPDEKKTQQTVLGVLHKVLDFLVKEEGEGYARDFFNAGISLALVSLIRSLMQQPVSNAPTLRDCLKLLNQALQNPASLTDKTVAAFFPLVAKLVDFQDDRKIVRYQTLECVRETYRHASKVPFGTTGLHVLARESGVFSAVIKAVSQFGNCDTPELVMVAIKCVSEIVHPFDGEALPFPTTAVSGTNTVGASLSDEVNECPQDSSVREAIATLMLAQQRSIDAVFKASISNDLELSIYALRILYQLCRFSSRFSQECFSDDLYEKHILQMFKMIEPNHKDNETHVYKQLLILSLLSQVVANIPSFFRRIASQVQPSTAVLLDNVSQSSCDIRYKCCAMSLLSAIVSLDSNARNTVAASLLGANPGRVFRELLSTDYAIFDKRLYPRIEGSSYGFSDFGLLDGLFSLWSKLLDVIRVDFASVCYRSGVWEALCNRLSNFGQHSELSPNGVRLMLDALSLLLQQDNILVVVADSGISNLLLQFLRVEFLDRVANWPATRFGGVATTNAIMKSLCDFYVHAIDCSVTEISSKCTELLLNEEAIKRCIYASDVLSIDDQGFLSPLRLIYALIKKTGTISMYFSRQFVKWNGLDRDFVSLILRLSPSGHNLLVLQTSLEVFGILARNAGKELYEQLQQQANILEPIKSILSQTSTPQNVSTAEWGSVKSKACQLVGNLCRHSDYFYDAIEQYEILSDLSRLCLDPDAGTRKFACFAIGNAGFHNSRLYKQLRYCVPSLLSLLKDPEEKTRANAAGALGNLARNSSELASELLKNQVVDRLLDVAENDNGTQAVKIALFSLGNYCVYQEFRTVLARRNLDQVLQKINNRCKKTDPEIPKYLARLQSKFGNKVN